MMKNKKILFVVAITLVLSVVCGDDVVDDVEKNEENEEELLIKHSESKDTTKALELLKQSHDLDINEIIQHLNNGIHNDKNSTAYNLLGEVYLLGLGGTIPNFTHAFELFHNCSNMYGHPDCQYNRAFMYKHGLGVNESIPLSILNYYFAATGGNALAQMTLGYYHMHGYNVPKSCQTASKYYNEVAENVMKELADDPSPGRIIERIRLADAEARMKSPDEDEDVIQYYEHSASSGDVHAQVALGQLYHFGARGVQRNPQRAVYFFEAAATQGDARAMATLGQMYAKGIGVKQDNATAFEYFEKAAKKGNVVAQNGLGYMYMHGYGVKKNIELAITYLKKASLHGSADAQFNLGVIYFSGFGIEKSFSTALKYFTMASHLGHTRAMFNLGQMHLNGLGTVATCSVGVKFLKTVAERGIWANHLSNAHRAFLQGSYDSSVLQYMRLSDAGYEVAQSNTAWLFGPLQAHDFNTFSSNRQMDLAFNHYKLAATQGNIGAQRVIGDYYYYGIGSDVNYEEAASKYLLASDKRDAQATFNMGFMHQYGVGVTKDFHLAKRYFDQTLSTQPTAFVPVRLALFNLWMQRNIETKWRTWWPTVLSPAYYINPDAMNIVVDVDEETGVVADESSSSSSWSIEIVDVEELLLYLLCGILAVVVYLRSQARH